MFFEAESLLWRYCDDTAELAEMLERPRYRDLGQFVIGALDDPSDAATCIRAISSDTLLMEAFNGRLGSATMQGLQEVAHELLHRVSRECTELTLPTITEETQSIRLELPPWPAPQWSLACTVGAMVARGHFWEPVTAIMRRLDERWYGVERGSGRRANLLGDGILTLLYTGTSLDRKLAISALLDSARMARWHKVDAEQAACLERAALDVLQSPRTWTPGVLLFVGNMRVWHSAALQGYLPAWFDACWETGLDHLRLVAAESLNYGIDCLEEAVKEKLVQRLQEIWNESTDRFIWGPIAYVMEALIAFGALEHPSEGHILIASREVEEALADEETEQACLLANKVYEFQFEEYIGDAYCAALGELDAERRLLLLLRAAKAAARDDKSAPSILIQDLLRFDDPRVGAALAPWARVPIRSKGILNDGPEAFVYANAGLGRLGYALPDEEPREESPVDRVWRDMGKLIHALNTEKATPKEPNFRSIWSDLQRANPWITIDVLRQVSSICERDRQSSRNSLQDPADHFPVEICKLATRALMSGTVHSPFRRARWGPTSDPVTFAIHLLASVGDASCVDVLQELVDDTDWGADAVRALREIRGRDPK